MIKMQDGHCLDRKTVNIHYPRPWSIKLLSCASQSTAWQDVTAVLLRLLEWGERRLSSRRLNYHDMILL